MNADAAEPFLFRVHPSVRASIPHVGLGHGATPVEAARIDGLDVLIKRDDATADDYGGNKVRKLEFLLAEARAEGATRLITAGAAGSHHAFATAYHGRRLGFESSLVLFPQSRTPHVEEMLLLDSATGAELRWASRMELVPYGMWRARYAHRRETCHVVPPGGSSVTGTLGYVEAGLEVAAQIRSGDVPEPSAIYVAAGTLGTAAGLAVGLALADFPIAIEAVRITSRVVTNERVLGSLVTGTLQRLRGAGIADAPDPADVLRLVHLRHDQIGAGYGRSTPAADRATAAFADAGITLDPTYTAKAAAALLADGDRPGAPPLYWHTLSRTVPAELAGRADVSLLPAPFRAYLGA